MRPRATSEKAWTVFSIFLPKSIGVQKQKPPKKRLMRRSRRKIQLQKINKKVLAFQKRIDLQSSQGKRDSWIQYREFSAHQHSARRKLLFFVRSLFPRAGCPTCSRPTQVGSANLCGVIFLGQHGQTIYGYREMEGSMVLRAQLRREKFLVVSFGHLQYGWDLAGELAFGQILYGRVRFQG